MGEPVPPVSGCGGLQNLFPQVQKPYTTIFRRTEKDREFTIKPRRPPAARRKGKRSALVDHAGKNRHHKFLVAEMQQAVSKVTCVSGVAQRLVGKVAIITGAC